ncbi:GNAT family protein [Geomonas anaerohicana]|uniref:Delta-aminolevulinic acid dehydratase n=1 Tax=Geomonas anaerohicana TaxID=2798583 RepID=A0ABS0YH11_9BACT|nr:hypothetical protein [Geomonas anaerohicana]MBJ6751617.1 hypothetical protein [Geomonas anaerohicana]
MKREDAAAKSFDHAFDRLYGYCRACGYQGWDNFDGLNSVLFHNSLLYRSPLLRLAWTQLFKRSPVNLRGVTGVPKGYNPKGLALFITGLVAKDRFEEAGQLVRLLLGMTCSGYSGISWGYNFDWQSRNFLTPVGTPNAVTTVFVSNAMLDFHAATGEESALEAALGGCRFLLDHLVLFEDGTTMCFGYMPGNATRVHNVNMLSAALLARVARLTGNRVYLEKSRKAMRYSVKAMRPDYSWAYGESPFQQFIDSFHTGFNLVSLKRWMQFAEEQTWEKELRKGYQYYLDHFWLHDGCPKYYHDSLYPIDIHCSAQGILTCLELSAHSEESLPLAEQIARWAVEHMQDGTGYFYYQKYRAFTNKIPYIRWSQAWMFCALSHLTA